MSLEDKWETANHHWQDVRAEVWVLKVIQSRITFSWDRRDRNTCHLSLTVRKETDNQLGPASSLWWMKQRKHTIFFNVFMLIRKLRRLNDLSLSKKQEILLPALITLTNWHVVSILSIKTEASKQGFTVEQEVMCLANGQSCCCLLVSSLHVKPSWLAACSHAAQTLSVRE